MLAKSRGDGIKDAKFYAEYSATLRAMEPEDHVLINQYVMTRNCSLYGGTAFSVSLEAEKAWVASKTGFIVTKNIGVSVFNQQKK